jgi:REP element-mobilizing transposase RayT
MIASHVVFGCYGFWLPNDPRGSWSEFVGAWELFRYGAATKTTSRRSVAGVAHNRTTRLAAKAALQRPAVHLTGEQALCVSRGFARYSARSGPRILACAILPDHVHLVLETHRVTTPQIVIQLKGEASSQLLAEGLHPCGDAPRDRGRIPKCFSRGQWAVYLDEPEEMRRAIRYVEGNPVKEGKRRQSWSFVREYEG